MKERIKKAMQKRRRGQRAEIKERCWDEECAKKERR